MSKCSTEKDLIVCFFFCFCTQILHKENTQQKVDELKSFLILWQVLLSTSMPKRTFNSGGEIERGEEKRREARGSEPNHKRGQWKLDFTEFRPV